MSEHDQQVAVISYCEAHSIRVFAIPYDGPRSKRTAATLKAENVKPGMPDLFILLPRTESAIRRRWNRGWKLSCNTSSIRRYTQTKNNEQILWRQKTPPIPLGEKRFQRGFPDKASYWIGGTSGYDSRTYKQTR